MQPSELMINKTKWFGRMCEAHEARCTYQYFLRQNESEDSL